FRSRIKRRISCQSGTKTAEDAREDILLASSVFLYSVGTGLVVGVALVVEDLSGASIDIKFVLDPAGVVFDLPGWATIVPVQFNVVVLGYLARGDSCVLVGNIKRVLTGDELGFASGFAGGVVGFWRCLFHYLLYCGIRGCGCGG